VQRALERDLAVLCELDELQPEVLDSKGE